MKRRAYEAGEEFEEKECSICNALANYYERSYKDVKHYIFQNRNFFERLNKVKEIFVIGHSLGEVDMPYFEEIKEHVKQNATWNVYWPDDGDDIVYKQKIMSLGINNENIKMIMSKEFFK